MNLFVFVTGILKDFLRELPQPLFPPELLEAVTSVMENNPGIYYTFIFPYVLIIFKGC